MSRCFFVLSSALHTGIVLSGNHTAVRVAGILYTAMIAAKKFQLLAIFRRTSRQKPLIIVELSH
jgi:hypothetical protein